MTMTTPSSTPASAAVPSSKRPPLPKKAQPTGIERTFGKDEIIVSKTDTKGIITYTNDLFVEMSGYKKHELIGMPHSIIRHPDMPRCLFKLMWDRIRNGEDIYTYVKNMAKNGDHYWVIAQVSPLFGESYSSHLRKDAYNVARKEIVGYLSYRRCPVRKVLPKIEELYALLKKTEDNAIDPKEGLALSYKMLTQDLNAKGLCYDDFIHSFD